MPFCSNCGFEVSSDDNFCVKCGHKLKKVPLQPNSQENLSNKEPLKSNTGKQENLDKDSSKEHFVDWRHLEEKDTTKKIIKKAFLHTFSDSDKLNIKLVNIILGALIFAMIVWISLPYLNATINIGQDASHTADGSCRYRLEAPNIFVTNTTFNADNKTMSLTITNDQNEDVILESIAKTYEFKFDNSGDTEVEDSGLLIPKGQSSEVSFLVSSEPYILGLDFSGCKKKKVSEWDTI